MLIIINNPFDKTQREIIQDDISGLSIQEVSDKHLPAESEYYAVLEGEVILCEEWESKQIQQHQNLVFLPSVRGDAQTKRTIGYLVVAIISLWIGQYQGFWYSVAALAVSVVGGYLVNRMIPLPEPEERESSQTFGWHQATTQQEGQPLAMVYGRVRAFGNVIGAYTVQGGNGLTSRDQTLHALVDYGIGPIQSISDIKINDQSEDYFDLVEIETRKGELDQSVISNHHTNRVQFSVNSEIKVVDQNVYTYYTVPSDGFNRLSITFAAPLGIYEVNDAGEINTYRISFDLFISDDNGVSWAPYNAIGSGALDNMTVEPAATAEQASFWLSGRSYARPFLQTGPYAGWWAVGKYGKGINDEEVFLINWVTKDPIPEAVEGADWGGESSYIYHKLIEGERVLMSAYSYISTLGFFTMAGPNDLPTYKVLWTRNFDTTNQLIVRVGRWTTQTSNSKIFDDVYLSNVTALSAGKFSYPRTALVSLEALATGQISGRLKVAPIIEGRLVQVHNGAGWSITYSNNPAWIAVDILTGPVISSGPTINPEIVRYDGMDISRIDVDAFRAWAEYCDELVDDGNGGTERRCEFDGIFERESSTWEAALQVAATSRAMLTWNGINVSVIIDQPRDIPVQLFSLANVVQDSFTETFIPALDRVTEITIQFLNREDDWRMDEFVVVDTLSPRNNNRMVMRLLGVTRQSQAWREAIYRLNKNRLIKRTITFETSIEAIAVTIGDLIHFSHDVPFWGESGRLGQPYVELFDAENILPDYDDMSGSGWDWSGSPDTTYLTYNADPGTMGDPARMVTFEDESDTSHRNFNETLILPDATLTHTWYATIKADDVPKETRYAGMWFVFVTSGGNATYQLRIDTSNGEYFQSKSTLALGGFSVQVTPVWIKGVKYWLCAIEGAAPDATVNQIKTQFYPSVGYHDGSSWVINVSAVGSVTFGEFALVEGPIDLTRGRNYLQLDRDVALDPNENYEVEIRHQDDTIEKVSVNGAEGSPSLLQVNPPLSKIPNERDPYAFGKKNITSKPFIVTDISRTTEENVKIEAIEYVAAVYDGDTEGLVTDDTNYSDWTEVQPCEDLSLTEGLERRLDGNVYAVAYIDYTMQSTTREVAIYISQDEDGEVWRWVGGWQNTNGYTIKDIEEGKTLRVRVRSKSQVGKIEPLETAPQVSLFINGKSEPPPEPTLFSLSILSNGSREFRFELDNPPLDLSGFMIRYNSGATASDWDQQIKMHDRPLKSSPWETNKLTAGEYTFSCRTIDTSGNLSETSLDITRTLTNPPGAYSLLEYVAEENNWA